MADLAVMEQAEQTKRTREPTAEQTAEPTTEQKNETETNHQMKWSVKTMQTEPSIMLIAPTPRIEQTKFRNLHWRYALERVLRLRKTGGLVDEDVLAALHVTLRPPLRPLFSMLSAKLRRNIMTYVASETILERWRNTGFFDEEDNAGSYMIGNACCERLSYEYGNLTYRSTHGWRMFE